ncbi:MAG: hypothetical protein K0U78_13520 [Actinomycetia bacterium]|nr:hypothetical protein [Actinomycetes bacterium]
MADKPEGNTVRRFGTDMNLTQMPVTSPYASGLFSAAKRSWIGAWNDTKARWSSLGDTEQGIAGDEFQDLIGDRQLGDRYFPGMSRALAGRLVDEYDHNQWAQQWEGRPVAEFFGALPPTLLDPVNIATLPVGGTSAARAVGSATLGGFLRNSAVAGVKAGAAAVPLEVAVEPKVYGELRPEMLAMTAFAPIIASPVLAAPGYAFRRITDGRQARGVSESPAVKPYDDVESITAQAETEAELGPPAPSPQYRNAEPPTPTARLDAAFKDYGGTARWTRAVARGDRRAIEYGQRQGFDMESPAIRGFLAAEANRAAMVSEPDPRAASGIVVDLQQWATRPNAPTERLVAANILREGADGLEPTAPYRDVVQALREGKGGAPVRDFMDNGPERLRTRHAQRTLSEMERVVNDDTLDAPTRKARLAELHEELESTNSVPREIREDFDREALMEALDTARLEAPRSAQQIVRNGEPTEPGAVTVPERPTEESVALDPETQQLRDYARGRGVDMDELDQRLEAVEAAMVRCRNGNN